MDIELELLRARVLYLEGIVAALVALHPRSDEITDFTPDVVIDTKKARDKAAMEGDNAEVTRCDIWLKSFVEGALELGGEIGSAEIAFRQPRA